MLSKRACVLYIEHARVSQKDGRVVFFAKGAGDIEQAFNVPDKNTAFVLLGQGTSITVSATRLLSESNVVVGFCGTGGSPLIAAIDPVFLLPQDEYRPTQYMQGWARQWFDEESRLAMGKAFLRKRVALGREMLAKISPVVPVDLLDAFLPRIEAAADTQELLAAEGWYVKRLYRAFADYYGIEFARDESPESEGAPRNRINALLNHGNYLAYGFAACVLHGLGISYAMPVLHGKTRRGALVFDVADLMKDWLVVPVAFLAWKQKLTRGEFREEVIDLALEHKALDRLFAFLEEVAEKSP